MKHFSSSFEFFVMLDHKLISTKNIHEFMWSFNNGIYVIKRKYTE